MTSSRIIASVFFASRPSSTVETEEDGVSGGRGEADFDLPKHRKISLISVAFGEQLSDTLLPAAFYSPLVYSYRFLRVPFTYSLSTSFRISN